MKKSFLILLASVLTQTSAAAEFECKSGIFAVVAMSKLDPVTDQFVIKGATSEKLELRFVSIRFNSYPLREARFDRLEPSISNTVNYNFFDGEDFSYELHFPKKIGKTFNADISISQDGYIGSEPLECTLTPDKSLDASDLL